MCCHWQRHYFEVSNVNHDDIIEIVGIEGIEETVEIVVLLQCGCQV